MLESEHGPRALNQERLASIPRFSAPIYYFQGCTEKRYPGINNCFIKTCKQMGQEPVVSDRQSCCTGNFLPFNTAPVDTVVAITQRNYNLIKQHARAAVTTCNGCFSSFQNCDACMNGDPALADRTQDVMEKLGRCIVDDVEVFHVAEYYYKNSVALKQAATHRVDGCKVAVHYGCHFLHQEDPAVLLDVVDDPTIMEVILRDAGAEVVQYKERLTCCGAGLNQRLLHDDHINALSLTLRKMRSIAAHDADAIVVVCPYCQLHLDNSQVELEVEFDEEFSIPVIHLTQFIGLTLGFPLETLRFDAHQVRVDGLLEKLAYSP